MQRVRPQKDKKKKKISEGQEGARTLDEEGIGERKGQECNGRLLSGRKWDEFIV